MSSMKENIIKKYLAEVDFNSNWNYKAILEDLQKLLDEKPGMDVKYRKDVTLNEDESKAIEVKKIDEINIVFTDLDDKIKSFKFKPDVQ